MGESSTRTDFRHTPARHGNRPGGRGERNEAARSQPRAAGHRKAATAGAFCPPASSRIYRRANTLAARCSLWFFLVAEAGRFLATGDTGDKSWSRPSARSHVEFSHHDLGHRVLIMLKARAVLAEGSASKSKRLWKTRFSQQSGKEG